MPTGGQTRLTSRRRAAGFAVAAAIASLKPCPASPIPGRRIPKPQCSTRTMRRASRRSSARTARAARRFGQAALRDPNNADLPELHRLFYRNLKQLDLAFKHYKRALELNPRHRGAHEYIGEAYLNGERPRQRGGTSRCAGGICLRRCEDSPILKYASPMYSCAPRWRGFSSSARL